MPLVRGAAPAALPPSPRGLPNHRLTSIELRRRKRDEFFSRSKVSAESHDPRQLWRFVDALLRRGQVLLSDSVTTPRLAELAHHRSMHCRRLSLLLASVDFRLVEFRRLAIDDVITAVPALPDKQSASNPLPTRLFKIKENVDPLAPFSRRVIRPPMQRRPIPMALCLSSAALCC